MLDSSIAPRGGALSTYSCEYAVHSVESASQYSMNYIFFSYRMSEFAFKMFWPYRSIKDDRPAPQRKVRAH